MDVLVGYSEQQKDRPMRVAITERHHGTALTIRLGRAADVSYEDVAMQSLRGGRYWRGINRISKGIGWIRKRTGVDIYHAYQRIPVNAGKYVLSFDGMLPFLPGVATGPAHYLCRALLASKSCRALLPHSKHALGLLKSRNLDSTFLPAILGKAEVVYPAVEYQSDRVERLGKRPLRLLFVGRQFFIKGGHLMLDVLSNLRRHFEFEIVIVSSLSTDDWTANRSESDRLRATSMMADLGARHFVSLPRSDVLEWMKWADMLLLPSIDETFGFVLLEAMACGAVPIGTATRAIPEVIDDGLTGSLLHVPLDSEGVLIRDGRHEALIATKLESALSRLMSESSQVVEMGRAAQGVARTRFSPARLQGDLRRIYRRALEE